jgi:hypothetical protein
LAKPKPLVVSVFHHTHWDREWYAPFRWYQWRLVVVLQEILDRLASDTLPAFVLDGQTVLLEDAVALCPSLRPALASAVASGKLALGPWFVMPDAWLVSGESLLRNLALGLAQTENWGGQTVQCTGYLPDTFGHPDDMPQILQAFGLQAAVLWRGVGPQHSPLFQWQSPSGHRVFALHLARGYFQDALHDDTLSDTQRAASLTAWLAASPGAGSDKSQVPCLLPIGGDHLGPITPARWAWFLAWAQAQGFQVTVESPAAYMAERTTRFHGPPAPLVHGALMHSYGTAYLLTGVWSARLWLKQANRRLEHQLCRRVEPLLAMACAAGVVDTGLAGMPWAGVLGALQTAWRLLLLNHPHDSICGCSVDSVHQENMQRFAEAAQLAERLETAAYQALRQTLPNPAARYNTWHVWHTGDAPDGGVLPATARGPSAEAAMVALGQVATVKQVLKHGYSHDVRQVPLADRTEWEAVGWIWVPPEALPAYSYTVLAAMAPGAPASVQATAGDDGTWRLQGSQVTVHVDVAKNEVSMASQQQSLRLGFHDRPDVGDSYTAGPRPGQPAEAAVLKAVEITATGPLVAALTLKHTFPSQPDLCLETQLHIQASQPEVQIETRWVNHTADHCLQAVFDVGVPIDTLWVERHFSVVPVLASSVAGQAANEARPYPVSPGTEWLPPTGPLQRFVAAHGHLWATEGLTEYEVDGPLLRLTLLRAFGVLSRDDTGYRGGQAGPPFETLEGQALGKRMAYRYAWRPRTTQWADAYRWTNRFYGLTRATFDAAPDEGANIVEGSGSRRQDRPDLGLPWSASIPLPTWDNPHVVATALKPSHRDNSLELRLLNLHAAPIPVALSAPAGMAVALCQRPEGTETFPLPVPWQVGPWTFQTLSLR